MMRRACKFIDRKDLKGKVIGQWMYDLPSFLRGGLGSKRHRFWFFLSRISFRLKRFWRKLRGKPIPPMFEIASNPSIKLSEIKERRFYIK